MFLPLRWYLHKHTFNRIQSNFLHLPNNLLLKFILIPVNTIQICLKLPVWYFISRFVSSIQRSMFLHWIIGEMNLSVKIVYIELVWWSSDIALPEPIGFKYPVNLAYHHVMSDIKFSSFIEKWSIYIQLHYECFFSTIVMFFLCFYYRIELIYLIDNSDTMTSVSELSRFDNPYISKRSFNSLPILHLPLLSFNSTLSFFMICYKSFVLLIFGSFLDVES